MDEIWKMDAEGLAYCYSILYGKDWGTQSQTLFGSNYVPYYEIEIP